MINTINSRTILSTAAFAAAMILSAPAFAQDANLGVSANVTENCALSTTPVAFGDVDVTTGSAVPGAGSVLVTCTNGAAWTVSADEGAGLGAGILDRRMSDGLSQLSYQLYTEPTRTEIWGDGTDGETIEGDGTGDEQEVPIYARVLGGQNHVVAGSYTDTVVVTVTY